MYEARQICNLLLEQTSQRKFELTNLRLNKLLYFIHGWSLTSSENGLVRNHFLAWKLGPVIRPVYDAFKDFGEAEITKPATYLDMLTGATRAVGYDGIQSGDVATILHVFTSYDRFSTGDLVEMTHEPGGPWDLIFSAWSRDNRLNPRIPNDLIRKSFFLKAGGDTRH